MIDSTTKSPFPWGSLALHVATLALFVVGGIIFPPLFAESADGSEIVLNLLAGSLVCLAVVEAVVGRRPVRIGTLALPLVVVFGTAYDPVLTVRVLLWFGMVTTIVNAVVLILRHRYEPIVTVRGVGGTVSFARDGIRIISDGGRGDGGDAQPRVERS